MRYSNFNRRNEAMLLIMSCASDVEVRDQGRAQGPSEAHSHMGKIGWCVWELLKSRRLGTSR